MNLPQSDVNDLTGDENVAGIALVAMPAIAIDVAFVLLGGRAV